MRSGSLTGLRYPLFLWIAGAPTVSWILLAVALPEHQLPIFVIGAFVTLVLSYLITQRISRPIATIIHTARRQAQGDIGARCPEAGSQELAALGQAFNRLAEALQRELVAQQGEKQLIETIVSSRSFEQFWSSLLEQMTTLTGSVQGTCYVRDKGYDEAERFRPVASVGVNTEMLREFDSEGLEGQFGVPVLTRKPTHTKDIPPDTAFRFSTILGDAPISELLTLPILIDGEVDSIVVLGSFAPLSEQALDIVERTWQVVTTVVANFKMNEETRQLAEKLRRTNERRKSQAEALTLALERQNIELDLQKGQVEQSNRLKSEFLANMSHELRTPLNSILSLSRVLLRKEGIGADKENLEFLEIIERNGRRLLTLITDIFELAKLEAGTLEARPRLFNVPDVAQSVVERKASEAQKKGLNLKTEFDPDLPGIVSDPERIGRVLECLVDNAIKFTNQGDIIVASRVAEHRLVIDVIDTGVGIPNEELSTIFDAFQQGDSTASKHYEGTGLGLAIVAKTMKLLAGTVEVMSIPDSGSRFRLRLPLEWGAPTPGHGLFERHSHVTSDTASADFVDWGEVDIGLSEEVTRPAPGEDEALESPRTTPPELPPKPKEYTEDDAPYRPLILLVEDDPDNRFTVRAILGDSYRLIEASDGHLAIDMALDRRPDLVLLDITLPGMDGVQVARILKGDARTSAIPIIALSGQDKDEARKQMEQAGSDDFLAKPIEVDTLRERIEHWLPADVRSNA